MGKPKRCVYGLGFGRKRPNPRPSPNKTHITSNLQTFPNNQTKVSAISFQYPTKKVDLFKLEKCEVFPEIDQCAKRM